MQRKIRRDHRQLDVRNPGVRCRRSDHAIPQPPRLLQFIFGAREDLFVEETLTSQRTAEIQSLRAGEPFVRDRRVVGCARNLEQREPNGCQQSLKFDIDDRSRLHELAQQAIA